MGLEIAKISDVALQSLATEKDENNNGKLEKEEYNVFQKAAQGMLEKGEVTEENYMQAVKEYHSGFIGWFKEDSMVCKDTKDDGKIGAGQALLNIGQGIVGGVAKRIVQNPIRSAIGIGAVTGLTALTGGAVIVPITILGVTGACFEMARGIVESGFAKTDAEKKKVYEKIGTGIGAAILTFKYSELD